MNKDRITALFCVNKDKPMTMCYGKCYLKKQIADTKEQQEESGFQLHEMPILQQVELVSIDWISISFPVIETAKIYTKSYTFLSQEDIFHPPRTI